MTNDQIVDLIYEGLTKQRFREWYESTFVEHIEDSEQGPSKKSIKKHIADIFRVENVKTVQISSEELRILRFAIAERTFRNDESVIDPKLTIHSVEEWEHKDKDLYVIKTTISDLCAPQYGTHQRAFYVRFKPASAEVETARFYAPKF